jgi:aldose sugar dehydrogenase
MRRRILHIVFLFIIAAFPVRTAGQTRTVETSAGTVTVQNLADGLNHPWGMTFLPDGRLLVTERAGQLRILGKTVHCRRL